MRVAVAVVLVVACTHADAARIVAKPGRTVSIYMPATAADPALAAAVSDDPRADRR